MLTEVELQQFKVFSDCMDHNMGKSGCNDYQLLNTPENRQLILDAVRYGKSEEDAIEEEKWLESKAVDGSKYIYTQDYMIWGFIAHKIEEACKEKV